MSTTRALQCLNAIADRLANVQVNGTVPLAKIYLGREDLYGDDVIFPCASIIENPTSVGDRDGSNRYAEDMDVDVILATNSDPDAPLTAGHDLFQAAMVALFPASEIFANRQDRLGGLARDFYYQGREIAPREDGGQITYVQINTRVEYVLHADDPSK